MRFPIVVRDHVEPRFRLIAWLALIILFVSSCKDDEPPAPTIKLPIASFTFTLSDLATLPITLNTTNHTAGSDVTYVWSFENETSTQLNPSFNITAGGTYNLKLVATNPAGKDSLVQKVRVSPYVQNYVSFDGAHLNLFAWEGEKIVMLSRNQNLDRTTMFKWVHVMDATYEYYTLCNGREPVFNEPNFYIRNRSTIADVASTCGAGCGYLGFTGIEVQNTYFDIGYNAIHNSDQFDQVLFYEFGRNFWFCGNQLAYKTNDPVTTGYAVFMRFMAMDAAGVNGAPFGPLSHSAFQKSVIDLVDQYLADTNLDWNNTLGAGKGVPGGFGGGADLLASFCFRLRQDHGEEFVRNLWKQAALRPAAVTTQDAVDNFFLASCAAANKNLSNTFQAWRWPLSTAALEDAAHFP